MAEVDLNSYAPVKDMLDSVNKNMEEFGCHMLKLGVSSKTCIGTFTSPKLLTKEDKAKAINIIQEEFDKDNNFKKLRVTEFVLTT